ncbi:MAG: hypothetical protein QOJ02_4074 [Acidobacteriota bacterium]|jgi:hypothetical protein|nr:hypothetical protein [Acidobacteriota bacterium]
MTNQQDPAKLKCINCDSILDVPDDKKRLHCIHCGTQQEVGKNDKGEPVLCHIVSKELKWEEYKLHIELYKSYFDLGLRANVLFYLLTGGILTFYFSNCKNNEYINKNNEYIKYSLLLPILASGILGITFIIGAISWIRIRNKAINVLKADLGVAQPPDVRFLNWFLMIAGLIFLLVGVCMAFLFFGGTTICK